MASEEVDDATGAQPASASIAGPDGAGGIVPRASRAGTGTARQAADSSQVVYGVYVEHVELLFGLINDRLGPVFEANRYFEEHTGIANKAGVNNMSEALSHIGTLVEKAHEMTSDEQREQVAHFGDHLRRSMMESFEQVVKARLGKMKEEGLRERFNAEVVPLLRKGQLPNAPTEETVRTLGAETARYLDEGRKLKREHKWDAWDEGAMNLARACEKSNELESALRQGIGAQSNSVPTRGTNGSLGSGSAWGCSESLLLWSSRWRHSHRRTTPARARTSRQRSWSADYTPA